MDTSINSPSRKRKTAAEADSGVTAAKVLEAAVDSARQRAFVLSDAVELVGALAAVRLNPETCQWLSEKLAKDLEEIATDLEHAQNAISGDVAGGVYPDSCARFCLKDQAWEAPE